MFCHVSLAQSVNNDGVPEEGTYQVLVKDPKVKWVFTTEVLKGTEQKRKRKESVSIQIGEFAYLYLPSRQEINSKGYKKLEPILYE